MDTSGSGAGVALSASGNEEEELEEDLLDPITLRLFVTVPPPNLRYNINN
jgi:hypothetical protein